MGACLDDLIDLDVYDYSQDEEEPEDEPDLVLLNESVKVYFISIVANKYIIHVADCIGLGFTFPNENDEDDYYNSLEECKNIDHSKFIEFARQNNILE